MPIELDLLLITLPPNSSNNASNLKNLRALEKLVVLTAPSPGSQKNPLLAAGSLLHLFLPEEIQALCQLV